MVPKTVFSAVIGAALLGWSSFAAADEYRPGQFFSLDLSQAVLSPKPLGPPARFEPMRDEAKTDPKSNVHVDAAPTHVNAAPKAAAKIKVAHVRTERPRVAARTKVARRHSNPLDAQASDIRIQVWPCKSGGICNWQR